MTIDQDALSWFQEQERLRAQDLHDDLKPYVTELGPLGHSLRHPLVYQVPLFNNGTANEAYEYKRKALAKAIEAGAWHTVIWVHERPYRLHAFVEYIKDKVDAATYWELVSEVWVDSENIWQNMNEWQAVLDDPRPERHKFMSLEERAAFLALPDPITVYRGAVDELNSDGFSWTIDRERAEWFAKRFADVRDPEEAIVIKGEVAKEHCVGLLLRRNESEIVVREPEYVRWIDVMVMS